MYNRYQGNTGRFIRLPEPFEREEQAAHAPREPERKQDEYIHQPKQSRQPQQNHTQQNRPSQHSRPPQNSRTPQHSRPPQNSRPPQHGGQPQHWSPQNGRRMPQKHESQLESLLGGLGGTLSGRLSGLDTEDILLLAVIYLMYRESGDKQLLVVMAALLFL